MKNRSVKKVYKNFSSFTEEEHWLQNMLQDGWVLKKYSVEDEDGCKYVFEPIQNEEQKELIYKVDFREFNKEKDFEEYKDIFEDAGWTLLSRNKGYSRHVFYTEPTNAQRDIFSDTESYIERERRKMSSTLTTVILNFSFFLVSVILYIIFEKTYILGGTLFLLFGGVKYLSDYFKHRKVYNSLI